MFRFLVGKTKGAARSVLHRAVRAQGDRVQLRVHQGLPQPVGSGELEGVLGEVQGLHRQRDSLYKLCGAGRSVPVACSAPAHTADTGSAFPSMRERSKITQYVLYVLRTGCLFVDLLRCRNCPITFHWCKTYFWDEISLGPAVFPCIATSSVHCVAKSPSVPSSRADAPVSLSVILSWKWGCSAIESPNLSFIHSWLDCQKRASLSYEMRRRWKKSAIGKLQPFKKARTIDTPCIKWPRPWTHPVSKEVFAWHSTTADTWG